MEKENKFAPFIWLILVVLVFIGILYFLPKENNASEDKKTNVSDIIKKDETASVAFSILQFNKDKKYMVKIETSKGIIKIEMFGNDAPKTVENFVTLANKGYYNGVIFHRVIKGFMIQGGDPTGTGSGGPGYQFADELNPNTESYKNGYKRGVVAMANAGPNTNGSQFFIIHADYPLPNAYTIFGKVVEGIEVVDAIANTQTGPGDRPIDDIQMKVVTVEESK
ncbi:MAG: peptidylprolyl isomerase [bacterium]|nr:peptidylprolyl isomerase [bacterium]